MEAWFEPGWFPVWFGGGGLILAIIIISLLLLIVRKNSSRNQTVIWCLTIIKFLIGLGLVILLVGICGLVLGQPFRIWATMAGLGFILTPSFGIMIPVIRFHLVETEWEKIHKASLPQG